jgi:CelD/BcsL family acetyltransferase involved in cellulose biosynthesis
MLDRRDDERPGIVASVGDVLRRDHKVRHRLSMRPRVQPMSARYLGMAAGPTLSSALPVEGSLRPELVDPVADQRWLELLARSPAAGPFHHPLWLELLRGQYGYRIASVALAETDGELVAGLPVARVTSRLTGTRLVALPFSDVCPPVVADGASDDVAAQLALAIDAYRRREELELEVRAKPPGPVSASPGPSFLHHTLALEPDIGTVEARFSKSQIRRGINKARREGVEIAFCRDRAALDAFFHLHVRTRQHQGVPTQPKRFIRRFERLFDDGLGSVALARWNDATIAAAVFLTFNGTVVYKYGASDRRHLDKRPNNLLFMEVIRRACDEGAHTLDFGRTAPHNGGLAAFKAAWGATERELVYFRLGGDAPAADGGGVPAPVQKLIRHSPAVVGRLTGAALYRHFG